MRGLMSLLLSLANRFKEPSSWAGIAAVASVVGIHLDPNLAQALTLLGAGVAGVVAFFVPEKSK